MGELLIGESLPGLAKAKKVSDLYSGLELLEKGHYSLTVLNLGESKIGERDAQRILKLLASKKAPSVLISSSELLKQADLYPFIEVIPPGLVEELLPDALEKLSKGRSLDKQLVNLSKQKRSLPFYLLGAALFMEPLVKLAYLKFVTGFPFATVLDIAASIENPFKTFEFWLLFPLAGVALVRAAWWSLFVFLGTHVYSLYAHFSYEKFSWPYVQESPHGSSYLLLFLNTALFLYFLVPENRKPFVRKTKELFRGCERFRLLKPVQIWAWDGVSDGVLEDISETGALIRSSRRFELDETLELYVEIEGYARRVRAKVVRSLPENEGLKGFGVRFNFKKRGDKKFVRRFVGRLQSA